MPRGASRGVAQFQARLAQSLVGGQAAGQAASAELTSDGSYLVQCRPGRFKVSVTPRPPPDPLAAPATPPAKSAAAQIPPRYRDLGRSGLTVDVKEGDNTFDIAMTK